MRLRLNYALGGVCLLAMTLAAACSASEGGAGDQRLRVVASTALIAEFAERVAGPDAAVTALIPAGVDLHSFEPPPSVARAIARADLVLVNGYNLEESLLGLIEANVPGATPLVAVSASLTPRRAGDDHEADTGAGTGAAVVHAPGDPHFWLAVPNASAYVDAIRDALVERDPAHAEAYRERASAVVAELGALDVEVRTILAGLAPEERRLVVFHDGFAYFAAEYGFELVASVVPANPNQDPSAAAVVQVIAAVKASGVRTVFREPQFNSPVLDVVASEAGVSVGVLHSTFGPGAESYGELMRTNARALVAGLAR